MPISGEGYDDFLPVGAPGGPPDPDNTPEFNVGVELARFMRGVLNYHDGYSGSGGAYGISDNNWATYAAGAGMAGASKYDPAMQDYVAAYWMNSYYQKYRNWNLVAVAWKYGTGAANAVVVQSNKDPREITPLDIKNFASQAYSFTTSVMDVAHQLGMKDFDPDMENAMPLSQQPTMVITGTAHAQPPDPFSATYSQLQAEAEAEQVRRSPSGAEMLFAQLESLSGVVSGGEGRVDWRSDFGETESGGSVQELPDLIRPGEEDAAR